MDTEVKAMRFQGLDLNLLVALDALLREKNLTAAARSLNLSQPAMSAAVARLRKQLDDELFTMDGRRMVLTPRGESLIAPTHDILTRVRTALGQRDTFDPSTAERRFRIVISDFLTIVFFSKVIERVRAAAPKVTFELVAFDDQPDELIQNGEVDFLLFPEIYLNNRHPRASLFSEDFVCVACRSNRKIGKSISFKQYTSTGHVTARFGKTRKPAIEEWFLLEHAITRRVELAVQSFAVIPHAVIGTELIATMHRRLAQHFAKILPIKILSLPMKLPAFAESLQWPALQQNDPASVWLRTVILEEAKVFGRKKRTS